MMMPRSMLLWWCGPWMLAAALVAALAPAFAPVALLLAAVAMLAPVFDAAMAWRADAGLKAALPRRVRLTRDVEGEIELLISREFLGLRSVRVGLPMPAELCPQEEDVAVALPADSKNALYTFRCKPTRRGTHKLTHCYLGTVSPLGFWLKRSTAALNCEVRVYPNLKLERRHLATMFLNRGTVGAHAQRQIGHGRDFEQLREYVRGDSYGEIHWKTTAKRGRPITKVFQLERTQEVYVAIDSSRLSARVADVASADDPLAGQTSLDRFITAAMVMGMVAERQGDRFGVLTFSDRVDRFVRANTGKEHYRVCREAIYNLQPRVVAPDFAEVCSFVRLRLRRRALIILLTDLDDPILAENLTQAAGLIARQHLVLVSMIQPRGVDEVFSDAGVPHRGKMPLGLMGETPMPRQPQGGQDVYGELVGHLRYSRLRELEKVLGQRGVSFRLAASEMLCPELVRQYLAVKRRQLL